MLSARERLSGRIMRAGFRTNEALERRYLTLAADFAGLAEWRLVRSGL
jgi:hypothetical protein